MADPRRVAQRTRVATVGQSAGPDHRPVTVIRPIDLDRPWSDIRRSTAEPPHKRASLNLETAVGRARVGCDAVRWQGATTLRARAREEEQRGQRAAARLNRVRSAVTPTVTVDVSSEINVHAA